MIAQADDVGTWLHDFQQGIDLTLSLCCGQIFKTTQLLSFHIDQRPVEHPLQIVGEPKMIHDRVGVDPEWL